MKILFIHQYFRTPEQGGGIRTYYLAKKLVDNGFDVEVITAHNSGSYQFINVEGIKVHYLPVYYHNSLSFTARYRAFAKFILAALRKAFSIRNVALCYAVSTPLTVGLISLILKKLKQIPYIIEVGDLWPEAPVQMGAITNPLAKKLLYWFEKQVYQQSEVVVPYSVSIEEAINQKAPAKPTAVITNMADCYYFQPEEKQAALEEKYGVAGKFVISYLGTVGLANNLEYMINAAKACADRGFNQVHFIIAGEGGRLSAIKKLVADYQLQNVSFISHTGKKGVQEVLNVTDAAYISYLNKPVLETGSPNKFFDALAAGKLVIINMGGWIRKEIETNGCGFYTDPEKPKAFPDQLLPFLLNKELQEEHKANARRLALQKYSTDIQSAKFIDLINSVIKN
jgi:glycosyltransferase involved in cell wall biosynthesis